MSVESRVIETIQGLLNRYGRNVSVTPQSPLYADGLGLDSLGAAELSTLLEMAFGRDPYSDGLIPRNVEEIISFYETRTDPR